MCAEIGWAIYLIIIGALKLLECVLSIARDLLGAL